MILLEQVFAPKKTANCVSGGSIIITDKAHLLLLLDKNDKEI